MFGLSKPEWGILSLSVLMILCGAVLAWTTYPAGALPFTLADVLAPLLMGAPLAVWWIRHKRMIHRQAESPGKS